MIDVRVVPRAGLPESSGLTLRSRFDPASRPAIESEIRT